MPNTVAVLGGSGYLGSAVTRTLLARGCDVRIVARRPRAFQSPEAQMPEKQLSEKQVSEKQSSERQSSGQHESAKQDTAKPGTEKQGTEKQEADKARASVHYCAADIRDQAALDAALEGVDAVVNAVSLYIEKPPQLTFQAIHVQGAAQVAHAARRAGVRCLLHVSGIGADAAARSSYIAARGRGEAAVREAFPEALILRPSVLYGHGEGLIAILDRLSLLPLIPLFGRGNTRLQPVHVDDVAAAIASALSAYPQVPRLLELGGSDVHTYRQLLQLVLGARRRHRLLLPLPFRFWYGIAELCSVLPQPPLNRDQVALLEDDNVVNPERDACAALGLRPRSVTQALEAGDA